MIVTGVTYVPSAAISRSTLLLIPDGTAGQAPYTGRISELLAAGHRVMVFDPRGTGAVRMRQRNPGRGLAFKSTEFRVANDHFLLGASLAGRRVFDILRACACLRALADAPAHEPVELEAHGWPAIYGLLAAAVDDNVRGGPMTGLPESWEAIFAIQSRDPEHFSEPLLVPDLRGEWDIADLRALADMKREDA